MNGFTGNDVLICRRNQVVAMLLVVSVLLAGCATPQARINRHPELFASFPPAAQTKIRQGEIDLGFSKEMVRLALGSPDRIYERETEQGRTELWVYLDYQRAYTYGAPYGYRHRRHFDPYLDPSYPGFLWGPFAVERVEPEMQVEFANDTVVGITRPNRG